MPKPLACLLNNCLPRNDDEVRQWHFCAKEFIPPENVLLPRPRRWLKYGSFRLDFYGEYLAPPNRKNVLPSNVGQWNLDPLTKKRIQPLRDAVHWIPIVVAILKIVTIGLGESHLIWDGLNKLAMDFKPFPWQNYTVHLNLKVNTVRSNRSSGWPRSFLDEYGSIWFHNPCIFTLMIQYHPSKCL